MTKWSASQIKKIVTKEIKSERRYRDVLRKEDRRRFKETLRVSTLENKRDRKELERRLGILNHAHEEAKSVLGTYLPREAWERWIESDREWKRRALYFWITTAVALLGIVATVLMYRQ